MAQTGEDFLAPTATLHVSGTPAGGAAPAATIATPDTLPPLWPAEANYEVRALPFNANHEVPETDKSAPAAHLDEGMSSRPFLCGGLLIFKPYLT